MHDPIAAESSSRRARVLVTGAAGMLGQAVVEEFSKAHDVTALRRDECDLVDAEATMECVHQSAPQQIIHCAAYTDVDGCERDPERALRDNGLATLNVVQAAERAGSTFCYLSTDYVFDGSKSEAYREDDAVAPLNVYGRSKRLGEEHVQRLLERAYIVRTSWLYGPGGKNFVRTMSSLLRTKNEIHVVDDQKGSPTYTRDLARCLRALLSSQAFGLYHITNTGACTWYEFAHAIGRYLGTACRIQPCTSEQFPRPARRPRNSVLQPWNYQKRGLPMPRHWLEALHDYLQRQASE